MTQVAPPHTAFSESQAPKEDGAAALRERIAGHLLDQAYRNQAASLVVASATLCGLALLLQQLGEARAWWWAAAMLVVVALRLVFDLLYRRHRKTDKAFPGLQRPRWLLIFTLGQMASGIIWLSLSLALLPSQSDEGRLIILIVVSAMAGGATGVLAPTRYIGRLYITMLLAPPSLIFMIGDNPQPILAGLGFVFLGAMLYCHHVNHQILARATTLQDENENLVTKLMRRQTQLRQLNTNLEQRVAERTEAFQRLAHHDPLTGLHNRRWLLHTLDERLHSAPGKTAVLFLDLDRFKQINDGMGHDIGDELLCAVAHRFDEVLPDEALLARWGGDEFVVVMARGDGLEACKRTARALRQSLLDAIEIRGEPLRLDVSIGIAVHPQHGDTAAALIRAADLASAEVKKTGRGQIRFYRKQLSEAQKRRLDISISLREAINKNLLRLAYQPIVNARSGEVETLEALLRWEHPTMGTIRPDEFIPIAEESSRIIELGEWVLRRACQDAVRWGAGLDGPRVAVNVSIRQLLAPGFVRTVVGALSASDLPTSRLELEVTESVFDAAHSQLAHKTIESLYAMGVAIHIDDFGTGYSSLSRLNEFPFDAIKIDRSFVTRLDAQARAVIEGAILIARSHNLHVIAEGVETAAQATALHKLGVDAFQGYLLGRPDFIPKTSAYPPDWTGESDSAS